jgi:hypothetical protein
MDYFRYTMEFNWADGISAIYDTLSSGQKQHLADGMLNSSDVNHNGFEAAGTNCTELTPTTETTPIAWNLGAVTGSGFSSLTGLQAGSVIAVFNGSVYTTIGRVASVNSDTSITLAGAAPIGLLGPGLISGSIGAPIRSDSSPYSVGRYNTGTTYYLGIESSGTYAGYSGSSTTESNVQMYVYPAPYNGGVPNNFTAVLGTPPGSSTLTFTGRKNGTSQAVTWTCTGSGTTCGDSTHTFTDATADLIDVQLTVSGAPYTGTIALTWGTYGTYYYTHPFGYGGEHLRRRKQSPTLRRFAHHDPD